jgi:hypothetical protein
LAEALEDGLASQVVPEVPEVVLVMVQPGEAVLQTKGLTAVVGPATLELVVAAVPVKLVTTGLQAGVVTVEMDFRQTLLEVAFIGQVEEPDHSLIIMDQQLEALVEAEILG